MYIKCEQIKMVNIMGRKPVTKPASKDLRDLSNPIIWKKIYLKKIFSNNVEVYNDFVYFYKEAIKNGNVYAVDMAWIEFNKVWFFDDEIDKWVKFK